MALGPQQRASSGETVPLQSSESPVSRTAQQVVARLAELRPVHEAFAWFRTHARDLEDLQLKVTAIPAPPWGEAARGQWLRERFESLGMTQVHQDELGNVFAIRPGTDAGAPYLALSAHIDTVFPAGTEIAVIREGGKLYGPGISDNGSGITALLAMASVLSVINI